MIKAIVLTLLYTSVYTINCDDFKYEFSKIEKDSNKILTLKNQMGEINFFIQNFLSLAYITPSNILVVYEGCDPKISSILFTNSNTFIIPQQTLYNVHLTDDSTITVSDFFGKPEFAQHTQISTNESYKQKLIIDRYQPNSVDTISQVSGGNSRKRVNEGEDDGAPSPKKTTIAMSSESTIEDNDFELPQKVIDDLNEAHMPTTGYKLLYEIHKFGQDTDNKLLINRLNKFLKKLKPKQNILLLSKKWFHNEDKVSKGNFIYSFITKVDDSLYELRKFYKLSDMDNSKEKTTLNFRVHYIFDKKTSYIRIVTNKMSATNVEGFYILGDSKINTDDLKNTEEQPINLDVRGIEGEYKSTDEILNKFFNETTYDIDPNYTGTPRQLTKYFNLMILDYDKLFVLIKANYFRQYIYEDTDINKTIGILIEPTTEESNSKECLSFMKLYLFNIFLIDFKLLIQ